MNRRTFGRVAGLGIASMGFIDRAHAEATPNQGPLSRLVTAQQALRDAPDSGSAFDALLAIVRQSLPILHATALTVRHNPSDDARPGTVRRIYSTVPQSYPVGGWKKLAGSDWAETVLVRHETLVASGKQALAHYFPDHALLQSLGTTTLVNVPVTSCRQTIGAFAFMCEQSLDRTSVTDELQLLTSLAAPLFLAADDSDHPT